MKRNEWKKAISNFGEAIHLNSKDALAYEYRGGAYFATGDLDKAISDFTQAIQLEPTCRCRAGVGPHFLNGARMAGLNMTAALPLLRFSSRHTAVSACFRRTQATSQATTTLQPQYSHLIPNQRSVSET